MELRQLEHFLAVVGERNFTHAAELLQISQSGLSASVKALESELGTALFIRTTRRVDLTAAGAALVPEAARTVAAATAARAAVDAVAGLVAGPVAIGSEACPGVIHLARDLASFRHAHPAISMRLLIDGSATLLDLVGRGDLDVACVVPTIPPPPGIRLRTLGSEDLVVLSHPDRAYASVASVALEEVAAETFADFLPGASSRTLTRRAFAAAGLDYRVELEVNDVHTLLDLIGEDLAIAVVPTSIARKRPDLVATPISTPVPDWTVCVATRDDPSPAAAALVDHFTAPPAAGTQNQSFSM